jgi:hypothetical protein
MTVIGALSSFRELGEMSPHKRASIGESSRGTFFRIPAAMPTFRYLSLRCPTGLFPNPDYVAENVSFLGSTPRT